MLFNRLDGFGRNGAQIACHAKAAIFDMTPRAPCNLRQFLRIERAHAIAVKFRRRGKGDVIDIQIQPHADGIGGHQIIHLAILI